MAKVTYRGIQYDTEIQKRKNTKVQPQAETTCLQRYCCKRRQVRC